MRIPILMMLGLALPGICASGICATTLSQKKDGNTMTYRLVHPLHRVEAISSAVVYAVEGDAATQTLSRVAGAVDVTTFDSGNSNRDSHAMEVIDALSYPEARFVGSRIVPHGDSLTVTGQLTFHGITREVTARALQHWAPGSLTVSGGFTISLADFNVERPSLLMIPVEDQLTFSFTAAFDVK